jgi:hypothetical protein
MARPKLGTEATDGATAKMEVRGPASLRDAAEATLDVANKETLSAFVRKAMEREVKRRSKKQSRSG